MARSKQTKLDFIEQIYKEATNKKLKITRKTIKEIISQFLKSLKNSLINLKENDRIELRGFGTFGIKLRKARVARNPKTGEEVKVPSRKSVFFKPGRELKKKVSNK